MREREGERIRDGGREEGKKKSMFFSHNNY